MSRFCAREGSSLDSVLVGMLPPVWGSALGEAHGRGEVRAWSDAQEDGQDGRLWGLVLCEMVQELEMFKHNNPKKI